MARKLTAKQKQSIYDLVPKQVSKTDRARITYAIKKSIDALDSNDGVKAAEGITEFRAMMRALNNRWIDCGDHCQHLLDKGNAPGYGVCYWACIARGGPNGVMIASALRNVMLLRK